MKDFVNRWAIAALLLPQILESSAQWTGTSPEFLTGPISGVAVGTVGATPSALTVRGDQMTPTTGNVFETDALGSTMTNWKMLHGGAEIGRLFSQAPITAPHFDIAAMDPVGRLRFWTLRFECPFSQAADDFSTFRTIVPKRA